jgi:sirohydrochlorin ferrochelatase
VNRDLILCAHGSPDTRGRAALAGLVNAVRREAPTLDVLDAYVDIQLPSIDDVVSGTAGPRTIVPLMLTSDRPIRVDIARVSQLDPLAVSSAPLGPDWVLAEVGVRRLFEAGARATDTIVLAADVTTEDRAVSDIGKAARLLSAVWGGRVHVGSLGGPDTPLAEAVDVARAYGRRIVVSTYVLTPGAVCDEIASAGADVVTDPLLDGGPPDPRLVTLVLDRARLTPHNVIPHEAPRPRAG